MPPRKKKKKVKISELPTPFFEMLWRYYFENKGQIRRRYKKLSLKFLDHNDPDRPGSWLRRPQFEALEMYIFLKEYCDNQSLAEIVKKWANKEGIFKDRKETITQDLIHNLDDKLVKGLYDDVYETLQEFRQEYSNYIFALTMGLGKTVLMATSIFYEFLLANKWPKDPRFCHNALVFAPDKTVLQSLREIETLDKSLVVPPEYVSWLEPHLSFHFLEDSGATLSLIDRSKYNIIVSNTQKIILKKKKKKSGPANALFKAESALYETKSIDEEYLDLYGFDEADLVQNQRFAKLLRLEQLGIYVDEAHHVFGANLAKDLGMKKATTSLRLTINEIAANIKAAGSNVVGCYNYTGTPYVGRQLLPEVVYAYGLRESINNNYLKKTKVSSFTNTKTSEFVEHSVKDFYSRYGEHKAEGMLPKMAFFATTINELQQELRPAVEKVLDKLGIPLSSILVNVGDDKLTSNDDLREFRLLDTEKSEKQFILLVNKGKEGWNCRSLFAVALHREPKSKIFVLQAAMRCLRSIGDKQETGLIFLSDENLQYLEKELEQNFRMSLEAFQSAGEEKDTYYVKPVPPPIKIPLRRVKKMHRLKEKVIPDHVKLDLEKVRTEQYEIVRTDTRLVELHKSGTKEVIKSNSQRIFSELTLVAEVGRYLNRSCVEIRNILLNSEEGIEQILDLVNFHNDILFDWVIPHLFKEMYELVEFEHKEDVEVELVKDPGEKEYYTVRAQKDLVASYDDLDVQKYREKSFHLNHYCFDSGSERDQFWAFLKDGSIKKVWFTGMLTHGQSDFYINYIDPESHKVRSYFPDFVVVKDDGSYELVEVKADYMLNDPVIQAKTHYAKQLAEHSGMKYSVVKASEVSS